MHRRYSHLNGPAGARGCSSSQMGHRNVRFTFTVYASATKRRERLSGPPLRTRSDSDAKEACVYDSLAPHPTTLVEITTNGAR